MNARRRDAQMCGCAKFGALPPYSPNVNNVAFPPAAVVLIVRVRSVAKRSR